MGKSDSISTNNRLLDASDSSNRKDKLFITYAWDNEAHKEKVLRLTAQLRIQGYNATMDRMLIQQESCIDFRDMIHRELSTSGKVIVVLSNGYKSKADKLQGGVGIEYQLIRKYIDTDKNKFILVSLEGISDDIIPFGLNDRFIVDLSKHENWQDLYARLNDQPIIILPSVGKVKHQIIPRLIEPWSSIDISSEDNQKKIQFGINKSITKSH
jgi:hypothetical protein